MPSIASGHSLNTRIEDSAIKCVCLLLRLVNNTALCDEGKRRYRCVTSMLGAGQGFLEGVMPSLSLKEGLGVT